MEMALSYNLGVKMARTERGISETGVMAAKSAFDTLLAFDINYLLNKNDQTSIVFGTVSRTHKYNLGVSRLLPSGTRGSIQWTNERNSTDSAFASVNPLFESAFEISIEQPLIKNFFGYQDRGNVNVARKDYHAADALAQRRVREAVFQVLSDYWRWITDRRIVAVTKRSAREARQFVKISEEKESFGLHESTDVLDAKANQLRIEAQLILDKLAVDDRLGQLRRDLDLSDNATLESDEKIKTDATTSELGDVLAHALENRTDYLSARNVVAARKIELALAKNSRWPELDLVASLRLNGIDSGYGKGLEEAVKADHPSYFIGGEFSFPIENRLARSSTKRASLEEIRALYALKDLENQITQNVEEQWRAVDSTRRVVKTLRRVTNVERKKWQEELKKYKTGRSSSDIVTRYQEDYLRAERNLLGALFDYRMSVLGLRLAQNTLIP